MKERLQRPISPGLRLTSILAFAFIYLPILIVMLYSFNDSKYSLEWKGFTLKWYTVLAQNDLGLRVDAALHIRQLQTVLPALRPPHRPARRASRSNNATIERKRRFRAPQCGSPAPLPHTSGGSAEAVVRS